MRIVIYEHIVREVRCPFLRCSGCLGSANTGRACGLTARPEKCLTPSPECAVSAGAFFNSRCHGVCRLLRLLFPVLHASDVSSVRDLHLLLFLPHPCLPKTFNELFNAQKTEADILSIVSKAEEFEQVKVSVGGPASCQSSSTGVQRVPRYPVVFFLPVLCIVT